MSVTADLPTVAFLMTTSVALIVVQGASLDPLRDADLPTVALSITKSPAIIVGDLGLAPLICATQRGFTNGGVFDDYERSVDCASRKTSLGDYFTTPIMAY